jgi:hypothetical protein
MPAFTNGYISLGGTNLSTTCKVFTAPQRVAMLDDTVMGDTTSSQEPGLKDWTITAEFLDPYSAGASGSDAIIAAALGTTAGLAIEIRPVNATVTATNPKWTGTGIVESYEPALGTVGDQMRCRVTLRPGGATPALTRGTS